MIFQLLYTDKYFRNYKLKLISLSFSFCFSVFELSIQLVSKDQEIDQESLIFYTNSEACVNDFI